MSQAFRSNVKIKLKLPKKHQENNDNTFTNILKTPILTLDGGFLFLWELQKHPLDSMVGGVLVRGGRVQ